MSTKFQKKPVQKQQRTPTKKVVKKKIVKKYLYYSPRCAYSIELLNILAMAPRLAKQIKCVNILEYDVTGIKRTPAIDDGISEEPHQSNRAFQWVMTECYKLLESRLVDRESISLIEIRIRDLSQRISRGKNAPIEKGHMRMNKNIDNPLEKWDSTSTVDNLNTAVYQGENIMDKFQGLVARRDQMKADGSLQAERNKNSEASRMQMLEQAQRIWREQGRFNEDGTPKQRQTMRRDDLKSATPIVTAADIKRYEDRRAAMTTAYPTKGAPPPPRAPISRHASYLGTEK